MVNTLQTNGFAIDEDWCRFFKEHDFLIGVSVDGTAAMHDRYRHDPAGGPTYERVRKTTELFDRYGVEYNILTVVTRQIAEHAEEVYREYQRNGWRYQQYIACLDPLGEEPGGREYSLTPEAYGSAYPCDFYAVDEYCLGNYNENTIDELTGSERAKRFVRESLEWDEACGSCPWVALCRNGCRRHRVQDPESGRSRNYFCRGYKIFFEKCAPAMQEIAQYLKK